MIKRFLCYVSEFFYHTLTPIRAHPTPITLYRRRAFITLEESLRRRWIGQSTDRVCGARIPPPSTPAEDSGVRGLADSLSPRRFSSPNFPTRSYSRAGRQLSALRIACRLENCCAYRRPPE